MKTRQAVVTDPSDLLAALPDLQSIAPDWILVFAAPAFFSEATFAETLRRAFPDALLSGCSTAGEINRQGCQDGTCILTAVRFDTVRPYPATTSLEGMEDSRAAGLRIGRQLPIDGLRAIMVFGPGVQINASALLEGIAAVVGRNIPLTGGLAGDGGAFRQTWTLGPAGATRNDVVAIGFYGDRLHFSHGSYGGWETFGPARKVTRCEGNILFELDGAPALDVYKRYLGDYARDLPASGLLFPFAMLGRDHGEMGLIRTILGISENDGSLTLAGEIDPDGYLKLMHASTDRLVGGAEKAAEAAHCIRAGGDGLAVLVSCVGRKLVMGERVDEEVEAVADIFAPPIVLSGFYAYGEFSPFGPERSCHLHNQTMTVAYLSEI